MRKPEVGRSFTRGGQYTGLLMLAALWLLPFVTMLVNAAKSGDQIYTQPYPWQFPKPFSLWANLRYAWVEGQLGRGFLNSLLYGVAGAAFAILFASLAAYSLVRLRPRGRFYWFLLIYSGTIFPFQIFLIPLFRTYIRMGIYDTHFGMILFYTAIAIPFCLFVLHNYFATIPRAVSEAAVIDGAGRFCIYRRMYLPLSGPALAVLFLFQFTWIWNDLLFGLILSKSPSVRPIMTSLAGLMGIYSTVSFASVLAGGLIASVPTFVLFVLLRQYFTQGLTLSTAGQ